MKKRFTILMAAFTLLAFLAIPMGMKGQSTEIAYTFSDYYDSNTTLDGVVISLDNVISATFNKANGSTAPQYYTNGTSVRWYAKGTLVIDASNATISNIEIAYTRNDNSVTANVGSYSHPTGSSGNGNWSGSASSVTFTQGGTSGHDRVSAITVTYTTGGTPQPTTYTVTYNCNGGTSGCPENATNITAGTTIQIADAPSKDGFDFAGWSDGTTTYDDGDSYTVNSNVTFTAQWTEQNSGDVQWVLTSLADLTTNDVFVIVGNNGSNYAMSNDKGTSAAPTAVSVTVANDQITSNVASTIQWTGITGNATDGYTFYSNVENAKYLYCISQNNGVRVGTGNNNNTFIIKDNYIYNVGQGRYVGVYNNTDWRCYTSIISNIASQTFAFYKKVTGGVLPPSITASNVDIEYNATSGSITYTINNGVNGGAVTATTESNWLTLGQGTASPISFTCTANEAATERTATVTLTYTYNRETVTKEVTVTQAAAPAATLSNIAALTALTDAGNYTVTLSNAVVTYVNGNYAYIQDDSGAVVYYKNGHGLTAGDVLNGTATVAYQLRNGNPQITNLEGVTPVSGTAPDPTEVAASDWDYTFSNVLSQYFKVTGATITQQNNKYYITLGGESIQLYKAGGSISSSLDLTKTYSITGFPTMYNTTKELQIFVDPEVEDTGEPSITVTPALVEVNYEEHDGTLALTYENIDINDMNDFVVQYYNAEGEDIDGPEWIEVLVAEQDPTIGEGYVVSYFMYENEGEARSAYFKIYVDNAYSNLVTITQAQYVVDYATLPFEWDSFGETPTGITNNGVPTGNNNTYLKFDGTGDNIILKFNERPGTLRFYVKGNPGSEGWAGTFDVQTSVDGVNYTTLATYEDLSTTDYQEESFANLDEEVRYIKWVYTEKVSGNVAVNYISLTAYAEPVPAITVSETTITAPANGAQGTLNVTYTEIESYDMYWCESDGTTETDQPNWIEFDFDTDGNIIYNVYENEGEARTAYFKVYGLDSEGEDIYSELVTVNQAAYVAPVGGQFALFSGNLVEGDYIIYYNGKAMNNVVSSGRLQYAEIEPEDNVITTDNAAIVWHIAPNDEGYWTIYSADANAYAASTGVKNKAQMLEDGTDDMAMWTVTEISGTYEFVNKANAAGDVNANLRNNGTYGFACYATTTGGALSLYKYTETVDTYTMEIDGYGTSPGGYYLIASPVLAVTPTFDNGFIAEEPENYDLYYFDQAENNEWRNFKVHHFNIAYGKGYLYASKENTTLSFSGAPYSGDGTITLTKAEGVNLSGWNLVGNPYNDPAVIDRDFYVIQDTDEGSVFIQSSGEIEPMQGIFVIAEQDGETLTFETNTPPETGEKIVMTVRNNRSNIIDRALIRFGEGRQLPKFMFNPNNTKLYINQDGEEFAVIRSNNEGEMPVNFKAAINGTYTFSINADNVEMEYLHLLDNLTGTDVDLLATPNYTFEANTIDNANRFKLVYATTTDVSENNGEPFAFFNGNEWVISNKGNAILQVVDMTGRIISTSTINGNASTKFNAATGVYMLRLTNGNDVKTQRVIVK